ncbi:LOW QUALITY PROTEIN: hypothetical protein ACHAXA_008947 [Cyclostephanos tholiformis]|uniref:PDZ domain-containing protein n=1 Tax=Cyclostephanos tholiformis TaxID=382380 RepID=A0ABD3RJU6_9STRA
MIKGSSAKLGCFIFFLVQISNDSFGEDSAFLFVAARPRPRLAQERRNSVVGEIVGELLDPYVPLDDDDDHIVFLDHNDYTNPTEYPTYQHITSWPVPIDTPAPFTPAPIDTPAPFTPVPIDTPAPFTPVPIDTPAPFTPGPIDTPALFTPVPIDTPAPITPAPIDTPAPFTPVPIDTPAPFTPSPVTPSPVKHSAPILTFTPMDTPSPFTPASIDNPASFAPAPMNTPAPFTTAMATPSPVETLSPIPPTPVETPSPFTPVPVETFVSITIVPMTSQPTPNDPMTSDPTTSEPTTNEPSTSKPATNEPTTSEHTTNEPTHERYEPTAVILAPTTAKPTTTQPSFKKSYRRSYHPVVTETPTTFSLSPSRSSLVFLSGTLKFALPLGHLSESQPVSGLRSGQLAVFAETTEVFLQREMTFYNSVSFSNFSVTVATQLLPREQLEDLSDELIHSFRQQESSLIIAANVIALANPAEAAIQFPFQVIIHEIFMKNRDQFYDMLFSSSEFEAYSQERGNSSMRSGGGTDNTGILGSLLTGTGILISLLVAFAVIRQHHNSQKHEDGADCDAPPSVSSKIALGELRVPRLDDSSFRDHLHQKNAAHVPIYSLPSKSVTASDEWSVCDEDDMRSHSRVTDSGDSLAASSFDLDKDVCPETDSILQSAHEEQNIPFQTTNASARLHSPRELNLFVSTKMLRHDINATEIPNNVRGNVYKARAPPGPLGIVIEGSKAGPTVRKVKESSPLYHLVEPGDIILTIDGIDCRATDAHTLAEWITKKPWVPEHVLEILGDADARSLCSSQYDELSEC